MKTIEVDEELYRYIASQTHHIGESASDILRRLLMVPEVKELPLKPMIGAPKTKGIVVSKDVGKRRAPERVREIRALLNSDAFISQEKAIGRFMLVLSTLYKIYNKSFSYAASIKGRTRL